MWNRPFSRHRGRQLPLRTAAAAAVALLLVGGAVAAAESGRSAGAAPVVTIGEHGCGTVPPGRWPGTS